MSDDDILLTNNEAERALHSYVLWRKGCYGLCSHRGELCCQRFLSLVKTDKRLGCCIVPRSGYVLSSAPASRKRITLSLPNYVHQVPADERLRLDAVPYSPCLVGIAHIAVFLPAFLAP